MEGIINGKTIKSALALKIADSFKKLNELQEIEYPKIQTEKLYQDFEPPVFFIKILNARLSKLMRNQYSLEYQMKVEYHPLDSFEVQADLSDVGITLLESLQKINLTYLEATTPGATLPLSGKDISYDVVEGVLQLFATYTLKIYTEIEMVPLMEMLNLNIKKEEE